MLVLRGLSTLLVGYTVSILGAPSWTSPQTTIQLARSDLHDHDWNESGEEPVLEDGSGRAAAPTAVPPRPTLLQDAQRPNWSQGGQARSKLRTRDEEPASPAPTTQDLDTTESVCSGCGVSTSGVSMVFVTSTRTSTITFFTGSPVTSLVLTTATETLTFINPTQSIQTSTIMVTSLFRLARRTESPFPEQSQVGRPSGTLDRRQEATITSTITTVVSTTITTRSTVFATRTITIFVTVTAAPSAATTVVTTTTIFTTPRTPPVTTPTSSPTSTLSISSSSPGTPSSSTSTGLPPPTSTEVPPPPSSTSSLPPVPTSTSSIPTTMATSTITSPETMMSMMSSTISSGTTSLASGNPFPFPTTTPSPTNPAVPPSALPGSSLSADQIAGIVLGAVAGIFLIALAILAIPWCIRRRRSRLSATTMGVGATAAGGGDRATSPPGSATSGLTGQGEVRIVIRPARSQLWPMPPGHGGPTYSFFVEDTTTGHTTPARDPATWSSASESGSVREIPRQPILSASGPGTPTGSSSGGSRTASSGARSVPRTSGTGHAGPSTMRDVAGNSVVSVGWGTSLGARSSLSATGVNTDLSPPPPAHGNAANGGNGGPRQSGNGYPGNWGVGRAI